ncbi:hypothetical protein DCC39_14605 [Pueribacillus theae]|uniref:Uncharacterized protein n=1 Tax=Pueribacillus theae TaxID=2171751 RepID=A0A2U1JTZ0_9BACI|nr:hypothetical protein [Pueribacillus theae]PWA08666.1 hypothetical protein DCC39_14605 [Pueribacillus theae]
MARLNAANNAEVTLTQSVTTAGTTITVDDASVFPPAPFRLSIDDEIVEVIAVSGNTLTVERAKEGTTAVAHNAGVKAENRFTAGMHKALNDALDDLETSIGNLNNLSTTVKTNLVAAVNELKSQLGNLANLTTEEKSNLVAAINELRQAFATHSADYIQFKDDITAKVEGARVNLIASHNLIARM